MTIAPILPLRNKTFTQIHLGQPHTIYFTDVGASIIYKPTDEQGMLLL